MLKAVVDDYQIDLAGISQTAGGFGFDPIDGEHGLGQKPGQEHYLIPRNVGLQILDAIARLEDSFLRPASPAAGDNTHAVPLI